MLHRLAATAGALSLSAFAFGAPMAEAKSQSIFAFQCLKAGKNYVVGLGPMPRPADGVAINPSTIPMKRDMAVAKSATVSAMRPP